MSKKQSPSEQSWPGIGRRTLKSSILRKPLSDLAKFAIDVLEGKKGKDNWIEEILEHIAQLGDKDGTTNRKAMSLQRRNHHFKKATVVKLI